MAKELRLSLLGGLDITLGGKPVTGFISAKVPALLCYLAVTGRSHFRAELAGLLWGGQPEATALANLRKALTNLRHLLALHLIITPQTVAFNREVPYWLDVEVLQGRVDKYASEQVDKTLSTDSLSACLLPLREAVDWYRGEFLQGFHVRDAPAFEEWVLGQRECLKQTAIQALQTLAAHYATRCDYAEGIRYTFRLLSLDPWREEAHRQMMVLLSRSGQRTAALAQYETCRRILKDELGVEPMAGTTALYERIRAAGHTRPHNLPVPTTSFVGREEELTQVARLLAEPACRLLTVVGPGGIGKTRLALQAALQACVETSGAFPHGIYLASLASVNSIDLLVMTLATSVGVSSYSGAAPKVQLLNYLRDKEMLLILDSFEHLAAEAGWIADILQNAPQVKLLVTSRQRLNLQGEWLLELGGLSYPTPPLIPLLVGEEPGKRLEGYSAVRLFVQRARQARPSFELSEADSLAIVRICQLVDGMPLGLELAAAWVRALPCASIVREIEYGLDVLSAHWLDRPDRHQSMRAVFEHSWNLLTDSERRVFRQMAMFRGGFSPEAAEQVTGANLSMLSALVNRSLLRVSSSGRYDLHPLVHQYAEEKLAESPNEQDQARERHGRYYTNFVQQRGEHLKGPQQQQALMEMDKEIDNVRAAWRWAIAERRLSELYQAMNSLGLYYHTHGWYPEGDAAMGQVVAVLGEGVVPDSQTAIVLGGALVFQGLYGILLGRYEQASHLLQKSLSLLRPIGAHWEITFALAWLGLALMSEGEYEQAKACVQESLAAAQATDDQWMVGVALMCLGLCVHLRDYAEAAGYFRESLAILKGIGDRYRMAIPLLYLGQLTRLSGNLAEAKTHLEESLAFARENHIEQLEAWTLWNLGEVALASGVYLDARHNFQAGLALARQVEDNQVIVSCLTGLGSVALKQRKDSEAKEYFHAAFQRAVETRAWPHVIGLLVCRAEMLIGQDQAGQERAVEWLAQAAHHPATTQESRAQAERLLDQLQTSMVPEAFATAWERGVARPLETMAQETLADVSRL